MDDALMSDVMVDDVKMEDTTSNNNCVTAWTFILSNNTTNHVDNVFVWS